MCFQSFLLYLNSNVKCQPTVRSSRYGPGQNWFFAYLGRLQIFQADRAGMWATDSHTLARLLFTQRTSLGTLQPSWTLRKPRERIKLKSPDLSGAKETPKESSQTRDVWAWRSPGHQHPQASFPLTVHAHSQLDFTSVKGSGKSVVLS